MPSPPRFVLPSNNAIAQAVLERNRDRIIGASYNIGRRYQLQDSDREELISHSFLKIMRVDWRRVFRSNAAWIALHYPQHRPTWKAAEVAKVMNGYAYTLIRRAALDEVRRIRCGGLTGLGLQKLDDIKPHDDFGFDEYREKLEGEETPPAYLSVDGNESRAAGRQIAAMAEALCSREEWRCVQLSFGFDGGGTRTPTQVAREAKIPRRKAQQLLDTALAKLKPR